MKNYWLERREKRDMWKQYRKRFEGKGFWQRILESEEQKKKLEIIAANPSGMMIPVKEKTNDESSRDESKKKAEEEGCIQAYRKISEAVKKRSRDG
jgi:hypothetical protein